MTRKSPSAITFCDFQWLGKCFILSYTMKKLRRLFGPWWAWAIIALIYIILRINIINVPLDRDEGSFGYVGQVILRGGIPYKDVFEVRPPLVYYLNALALLLFGPTPQGIHLFLHLYNFLTLIVIFFTGKTLCKSNSAGLWTAFIYGIFSSVPQIEGFSASAEMLLLLPLASSLLFSLLAIHSHKVRYSAASGAFGALAFWTKVTVVPIIFFIFLCAISAKRLKIALSWLAGLAMTCFVILFYFYCRGALHELIYWCFARGFHYIDKTSAAYTRDLILHISWRVVKIVGDNFVLFFVGTLGCLSVIYKKNIKGLFVLGFLSVSLAAVFPGVAYRHYFAQTALAVAILGGVGFFFLAEPLKKGWIKTPLSLIYAITILLMPLWANPGYYSALSADEISHYYFGVINPFPESVDIAKFIKERTDKDDTIYIIGSEPQILLYTELKNACSFPAIYQLILDYPRHKEFQQRAWQEIEKNAPKYIVTVNSASSFIYDGKGSLWIIEILGELVNNKYALEAVMTIDYPKGRLYLASENEDLQKIIKNKYSIEIYRRK